MSETDKEEQRKPVKRISVTETRLKISEDGTQGVLLGKKCQDCGQNFFGAPEFCLKCTSANLKPVELTGEGVVTTYTIVRQSPPGWQGNVPYLLATVKVPEGPQIASEVVDCPEDDLKVGLAVELTMRVGGTDKNGNEIVVYKWRPKMS
jgi:uncharacterized OB-fold protein